MPADRAEELARRFQALADPVRLRLLAALAQHDRWAVRADELARLLALPAAIVDRHLRELSAAGLLVEHGAGRGVAYQIEAEALAALANLLEPPPDPLA